MAGSKRGQRRNNRGAGSYYERMAGVYLTDRDTVNKVERMKVTTCLNPLHTALAVYDMKFWNIIIGADSEKSI